MRLVLKMLVCLSLAGAVFKSYKDCALFYPSRSLLMGTLETVSTLPWALLCAPLYCVPFILLFPKHSRWALLPLVGIGLYINALQWNRDGYYNPSHDFKPHRPYNVALISHSDEDEVISQSMTSFLLLKKHLEGAKVFLTHESKKGVTSFRLLNLARVETLRVEPFNSELTLPQYNRVTSAPDIQHFPYVRGAHVFIIPNESRVYRLFSFQGNLLFLDAKNVT